MMIKSVVVAMLVGFALFSQAEAACLKDQRGEIICGAGPCGRDQRGDVYCAQLRFGSAFRTREGWIYCGKGQCMTNRQGQYICSDVEGGAVVKQSDGTIRCEGACEYATYELCERLPAGR